MITAPKLQWSTVRGVDLQCRNGLGTRLDRLEGEILKQEGALSACGEERIGGLDQAGTGAPVHGQTKAPLLRGGVFGLEIGMDIGPAKPIDGLLGIANHHQPRVLLLGRIEAAKNPILQRIGILKLIDHRQGKTPTQPLGQGIAPRTRQGLIQSAQQIIGCEDGALLF